MQEDAHEFLVKILENLISTWSKKGIKPKRATSCKHSDCNDISKMFKGIMVSCIKCSTCHSEYDTYQPFYELNLDMDKELFEEEHLDGSNQYNCSSCNHLSDAVKTCKIELAPPILIVNLNRFNKYGLKMRKNIEFPSTLDLTPHVVKKKKTKLLYELTALIIHEGRFSFRGHYFSYVKGFDNKWYKCDDEKIIPVEDEEEIEKCSPYILFYRMRSISRKSYFNETY